MSWAVERDELGAPTRLVYVPKLWARENRIDTHELTRGPGCPSCGYRFGWHTKACTANTRSGGHSNGT